MIIRRSSPAVLVALAALCVFSACGQASEAGFTRVTALTPRIEGSEETRSAMSAFAQHGGEARRAFRSRAGERLSMELAATPGARVEVSVARAGGSRTRAVVTLEADGAVQVVSVIDEWLEPDGWVEVVIALDAHADRPVALHFEVEGDPGSPAAADWGDPILLEQRDDPRPPNIVLVTLDTTRADVAADPEIAPRLARLARRGVAFTNAWSAATSTTPAHASILTGLPVERHGAVSNHTDLAPDLETLAELLVARGYQTAASVTVGHIGHEVGFGQGFGRFRPAKHGDARNGSASIDRVTHWLDRWSGDNARPFLLWVHLFDPHTPYGPPDTFLNGEWKDRGLSLPPRRVDPPTVPIFPVELPAPLVWLAGITNRAHVESLYRADVAYADHLVGRVVDRIDELGLTGDTTFVVTADHGEALGEHGVFYQHAGLWPESLRVPLVVAGPGWPVGVRTEARASGIDILPSLLATADRRVAEAPLHSAVEDPDPGVRVWFAESGLAQLGFRDGDVHFAQALRAGQVGVLLDERSDGPHVRAIQRYRAGAAWLFDTWSDPGLEHNLADDPGAGIERYRALATERARGSDSRIRRRALSESEVSALRALGYAEDPDSDRD